MKRRILSVFLAIALLCALFPVGAAQAWGWVTYPVQGGNLTFDIGTGMIESCDESVTAANIPGTINGVAVTGIDDFAFTDCRNLISVTIPAGATKIGDDAFWGCNSLTSVSIPDSVTSIGSGAFWECKNLPNVTIPKNVTGINAYTFCDCTSLKSVSIPYGVKNIDNAAFEGCRSLTGVTIPDSVTNIDDAAFSGCSSLTSVSISKSATVLGDAVFYGCSSLTGVTIPKSVTYIGESAFSDCSGLKSVTIQQCVASIGDFAFSGCSSLTSVTLQEGVPEIGYAAFFNCTSLTSVAIPESVTYIGESAFLNCDGLKDVYYTGSDAQWQKIEIDSANSPLAKATIHFHAFRDVPADAFYTEAVSWAVAGGITNGTAAGKFSPMDNCTRGQIVTFLWRASGKPEPTQTNHPFTDVSPDAYYYKAMLWAVEQGVTNGVTATTFGPNNPCTRGQAVTFLHRAASRPTSTAANAFTDVQSGAYYYDAVLWAVEKGIATGTSATTFAPDRTCTRGHIVTFLFRNK